MSLPNTGLQPQARFVECAREPNRIWLAGGELPPGCVLQAGGWVPRAEVGLGKSEQAFQTG